MAKTQGNVVNISNVVANPVLMGKTNKPIWTGMISSKKIDQYLIPDADKREAFKKLLESFERDIIEFRSIDENGPGALFMQNFNVESQNWRSKTLIATIKEKISKIKSILNDQSNGIDMDLFWFLLKSSLRSDDITFWRGGENGGGGRGRPCRG